MDKKFFPFHKGRMKVSSHNLGMFLIVIGLVYGFYLIRMTFIMDPKDETEYLKKEIIKLSKKYITALSKTNGIDESGKFRIRCVDFSEFDGQCLINHSF